jgi:hypothetical protein
VRFDKPLGNQQVGFDGEPVQEALSAGRQRADVDEARRFVAVVNPDRLILHDVRAEFIDQLRFDVSR